MKEDKDKEAHLEAVKKELNEKIEQLMGPTIEDQAPASKRISPAKAADPNANRRTAVSEPATAPLVGGAKATKEPTKQAPEVAEAGAGQPDPSDTPLDDDIDKAVDDIAAQESDELLKAEDEAVQRAFEPQAPKTFGQKIKDFFKNWWGNPKARKATISAICVTLVVLAVVPTTRYFILNTLGVRSSASVKVLDQSTQQPLRNVTVSLSGQSGQTDDQGYVKLQKIRLGKNELKVERRAFATTTKPLTIGWGSNPLGEVPLTPTGLQYAFKTTDFLSGKPIERAEAVSGYASAFSNANGELVLTLDTKSDDAVQVTIKADGYREENMVITSDQETVDVNMAPYLKHAFVSKRSGKFDVYKIDADGKNEELVLAGNGAERDDMLLAPHPSRNVTALVSTRENMHNSDGYLLSTLTIIDLDTNETENLEQSEKFQIVGWINDRLIYVKVTSGASTNNPDRHKLMSYDSDTNETKELAKTNYFNDVLIAQGRVYYAPSGAFQNKADVKLFVVDPDGNNRTALIDSETWNLFRTDYNTLTIAVGQAWYEYAIGGQEAPYSLNGVPADPLSRIYISSPNNQRSLWTDQRDGKGVLLVYDIEKQEDRNLASASGLTNPIRWLNNTTAVYRVRTDQETADYIVSTEGGDPKKLIDVTNTGGIDNWYYY